MPNRRIAFLLDSGISKNAGLPDIKTITDFILKNPTFHHHTNGNYYFRPNPSIGGEEYVWRVNAFLKIISNDIQSYYINRLRREMNYEDLYFVISQIIDNETHNYESPFLQCFINRLRSYTNVNDLLKKQPDEDTNRNWGFSQIAQETKNFIHDAVENKLTPILNSEAIDYLHWIREAYNDDTLPSINLFSLNHDLVLEKLFQDEISLTDGFDRPVNDVRYWNPELFQSTTEKIRLFKLHGSVNWHGFESGIGISLNPDIWHTKNPQGIRQWPTTGRSIILIGQFNKLYEYTSWIFGELHNLFYNEIKKTDRLIICGYGFGDKGINTRIIEWANSSNEKKIILIHKNPDEIKNNARLAIRNNWGRWISDKKLIFLVKWAEEVLWEELKGLI